ncbi:DUF418 domain-containing protein [Bacillus sp. FJAT-47783]|uniref:DUF418 domain-containing protein n=1 Tax=Bacillus sp. FJAT-47783 TaxID=2922712 RepID=UPI001FADA30B|nr:DUF418 domain-containing protein [Bacillus sp. FJAT-47783]
MIKRIKAVDALRGLSLFGILLANMLIFQYGIYGKDEISFYSPSRIDELTHKGLSIFVESSFMPIFAFLFGYGIIKMKESLEDKGLKVKRHLIRRFLFLLLLGGLHSAFLWEGDILFFYGMTGFLLLVFINRKKKTLIIWALITLSLTGVLGYGSGDFTSTHEEKAAMNEYLEKTFEIYGSGTFTEIMEHRKEDPLPLPNEMIFILLLMSPIVTLPMFLFGMVAAKAKWFHNLKEKRSFRMKRATVLLILGLTLKTIKFVIPDSDLAGVGYALGGPILAFGYIFTFSLLLSKEQSLIIKGFESVGRLSLTNYLLQTVICVTIFYGYGFGLFGKLGVLAGVGLAVVIFSFQWLGSLLYLKIFKTGPIEKILRMWTYLSWSGKAKLKTQQVTTSETLHQHV